MLRIAEIGNYVEEEREFVDDFLDRRSVKVIFVYENGRESVSSNIILRGQSKMERCGWPKGSNR